MQPEAKAHVLKRINNLSYSLNEILDMFHKHRIVNPAIREEVQDCIEEWGRILDTFKGEEVTEVQAELFKPYVDSVTHYLYQMFDFTSLRSWMANAARSKSALERFKLTFRTEQDLIPPERLSLFGATGTTYKIMREPIPPEFLKFAVFKDNPSAFSYYKKLIEMGESATLQQLAEVMGVSLPTTSAIITKLIREGWLEAERDRVTKEKILRVKRLVKIPDD
jgi:hypothetical protein